MRLVELTWRTIGFTESQNPRKDPVEIGAMLRIRRADARLDVIQNLFHIAAMQEHRFLKNPIDLIYGVFGRHGVTCWGCTIVSIGCSK